MSTVASGSGLVITSISSFTAESVFSTLYIANPDDETHETVGVNLNALGQGYSTGFGLLHDPDFGAVETDPTWIGSGRGGTWAQALRDHPPKMMRMRLRAAHNSLEDLSGLVSALAEALDRPGVIVFVPYGSTIKRYIDYFPSPISQSLRGQELALYQIARLFTDQEGYPLSVWVHPYIRRARITGTLTTLTGIRRSIIVNNPGSAPSPAKVSITPKTVGAKIPKMVMARIGVRSEGDLSEYATARAFELEDAAIYTDTSTTSDSTASPGSGANILRTSFATEAGYVRRWRATLQPGSRSSLAGDHDLYVVVKPGAISKRYDIGARWGTAAVDSLEVPLAPMQLDTNYLPDTGSLKWTAIRLGTIRIPSSFTKVLIEGWAGVDVAANLDWDCAFLMPADSSSTTASVPGFRIAGFPSSRWKGADLAVLVGAPVISGDAIRLLALNDKVSTTPSTGLALAAGNYLASCSVVLKDNSLSAVKLGEFRVRNVTDSTTLQTAPLWHRRAQYEAHEIALVFTVPTVDDGDKYRLETEFTNVSPSGRAISVRWDALVGLRSATDTSFVLDGRAQEARGEDTAGDRLYYLTLEGGLIDLPPGESVLCFDFGELPAPGWDMVDSRERLANFDHSLSYDVRADVDPSYLTL